MPDTTMFDILAKKRDGKKLWNSEIAYWIKGCADGSIPDYQSSALLMAAYINGMDDEEMVDLTLAMLHSGQTVDLSDIEGIKVDKHSTGGVGDKTTLVIAPILAAAGLIVSKMSGRGLGHTGGTLDKLESIPGFKTQLTIEELKQQLKEIGLAVISQTDTLVPADRTLYALRDVTATVSSIPFIASSIMSKKLALGGDVIVLDCKYGSGAFMTDLQDSIELAKAMVKIGTAAGKQTSALITSMEQPLGDRVGNALEVMEAIDTLNGKGPEDFSRLCLNLAGEIIYQAGKATNREKSVQLAKEILKGGKAKEKFKQLLQAQGGDISVIEDFSQLPQADCVTSYYTRQSGYIQKIDAAKVGQAALILGAGRVKKNDDIDLAAGILFLAKTGAKIESGGQIAFLYSANQNQAQKAVQLLDEAIVITPQEPVIPRLIAGYVTKDGFIALE